MVVPSPRWIVGVDFGLTTTDAVVLDPETGSTTHHVATVHGEPASPASLARALHALDVLPEELLAIAVTGGRSRSLPGVLDDVPITKVDEPRAIAVGGVLAGGPGTPLVVSCGTGTAIVRATRATPDAPALHGAPQALPGAVHVTGSAVGGGTLAGLGRLLVGTSDPLELADLASRGSASRVDTTLGDVLGGGVGRLPPEATAVNFGRVGRSAVPASREDLAAGLVTLIGQTIALLAVNAARAEDEDRIVAIGRMATLDPIRRVLDDVAHLYGRPPFTVPDGAPFATAWGAAAVASASATSGPPSTP